MSQLSSGGLQSCWNLWKEHWREPKGILKDLEFGVNGMLAPLNPQLQGLLPLDRSHDKFFQLHLFEVLTVHSGVLSYHLHGTDFPLHFLSLTKD